MLRSAEHQIICHEEPSLGNRLMATDCLYTCVTGNAGIKANSYALKSIVPVIPNEEKAVKKALKNNALSCLFFFASSGPYNN